MPRCYALDTEPEAPKVAQLLSPASEGFTGRLVAIGKIAHCRSVAKDSALCNLSGTCQAPFQHSKALEERAPYSTIPEIVDLATKVPCYALPPYTP